MEVSLAILLKSSFSKPENIFELNCRLEGLLNNIYRTNVAREIFNNIIADEGGNFDNKLEELFTHAIRNSYYYQLPKELYGLTLIGGFIFINLNYQDPDILCTGYSLVIFLHEIAYLSKRLFKSQRTYFELNPREFKSPDSEISIGEMGNFLESQLFGHNIAKLYTSGAKYITNLENWNKSIEKFQREFRDIQIKSKKSKEASCTLGQGKRKSNCIRLGRCGMAHIEHS